MKICLFCRYFYPHIGGNETQTMNLALELIRQGVEVSVVTGWSDPADPRYEVYKGIKIYRAKYFSLHRFIYKHLKRVKSPAGEKVKVVEGGRKNSWIKVKLSALSHFLEEYTFMWNCSGIWNKHKEEFDLIHSQMLMNYGYMALKAGLKLKKPVLIKDASLGGLEKVKLCPGIQRRRNLLRRKGYFVAVSTQIRDNLIGQQIPSHRIFKIPNGIGVEDISYKKRNGAVTATVLFAGNFWQGRIKGLDVLIRAMGKVVQTVPQAKLLVAGEGNVACYRELAEECKCGDRIEFLGQVWDMGYLYRESSVFVLPSRQEGMSNATLEAMSWGMPCVVTDVSGSSDQIKNGFEGIIVPVEDPEEMARAICYLLEHPIEAEKMGQAAKEKVSKEFDIKFVTSRLIEVYSHLLSLSV